MDEEQTQQEELIWWEEKCAKFGKKLDELDISYDILKNYLGITFLAEGDNVEDQRFFVIFMSEEDTGYPYAEILTHFEFEFDGGKRVSGLRYCNQINCQSDAIKAKLHDDGHISYSLVVPIECDTWDDTLYKAMWAFMKEVDDGYPQLAKTFLGA